MLTRTLLLNLANSKKLESFVRHNSVSARMARRFIAGETIEESVPAVRALNAEGITVSLDLLGESVTNEQEIAAVLDTYLRLFRVIADEGLNANVSLKLTALGLDIAPDLCERNIRRLLEAAGPEQFVRLDMEGSDYTQRTLDLFFRLWDGAPPLRNVGVVIQSYLYRSAEDIERLITAGARVRLCKGAYNEPADRAYPAKADVDTNYIRLMERLLAAGNYPAIATHDEKIIAATRAFAEREGIGKERFEFQMLYGIRRELQTQLARDSYNMRVYTPFGAFWYPYFMRRLAERPANLWFVLRGVTRG